MIEFYFFPLAHAPHRFLNRSIFFPLFEIINSLGDTPGVQISNMTACPGETRVDFGNRTRAAVLTAKRLATGPMAHSLYCSFLTKLEETFLTTGTKLQHVCKIKC
jgi:hypothetical protein